MRTQSLLRIVIVMILAVALIPATSTNALTSTALPPVDMFQLPWEQGASWVAIDGLDNGTNRPLNSSHYYLSGGAVDFAPHNDMIVGENTSNAWVTAAAAGTVIETSSCHLKIDHNNGWITEYQFIGNLQVKTGDSVYRNQRLAVVADGVRLKFCPPTVDPDVPHLHFTLRPSIRNATFSGWVVNYNSVSNLTTFTKGNQALGLFKPLLNTPSLRIVLRDPIAWDTVYTGNVDAFLYEKWPLSLSESTTFTLTATPTTTGLTPLIVLLDANGSELARGTSPLTSTQPAGSYFVQIQPQAGSGFYLLFAQKGSSSGTGSFVSTVVNPTSINVGASATTTVNLNGIPAEGFTSAEFTCTYNASLGQVSNIAVGSLFGTDPVVAVNGPQNGSFIVAIAGSNGNKASTSGAAFTFSVKGLQAGQIPLVCTSRVSKGDNVLSSILSVPANLVVLGSNLPTATSTRTATSVSASTATSTPTPTITQLLTATSTASRTVTQGPTSNVTGSPTVTSLPSFTPLATFTRTVTATTTATGSPTVTSLPSFTPLPTFTRTATAATTATASPTSPSTSTGTLSGQVLASKPVTVGLYDAGNTLVTSVTANANGSFNLTAPIGTYNVLATASGFLGSQASTTLTSGATATLPSVSLLAGDVDNNKVVDQFDAMTIGMNYNASSPSAADLNNDGTINVLDLELLARNYRKTGPTAWQ